MLATLPRTRGSVFIITNHMNKAMYILIAWFTLTIIGCQAQPATVAEEQNTAIYFSVRFSSPGALILNYIDSNYRNAVLRITHSKAGDTSIVANLAVKGPTVFTMVEGHGGRMIKRSLLCMPGDSVIAAIDSHNKMELSPGTTATDLAAIYGLQDFRTSQKEYASGPIQRLTDSAARLEKESDSRISEFSKQHTVSTERLQALKAYNKLQYYSDIFKIDYRAFPTDDVRRNEALRQIHAAAAKDTSLHTQVYTPLSKFVIHYTTQYLAKVSGDTAFDLISNLKHIDKPYHNREYLDGYVYDLLLNNESITTTAQREQVVKRYKAMLSDTLFFARPAFRKLALPTDVVAAPLLGLNGEQTALKSILPAGKKVILIDFWASWCAPCIAQLPYLKKANQKFSGQVQVLSLSIDKDAGAWKNAAKKYGLLTNSYLIEDHGNHPLVKHLALHNIPRIILINSKGEVLESDFIKPSAKNFDMILQDVIDAEK